MVSRAAAAPSSPNVTTRRPSGAGTQRRPLLGASAMVGLGALLPWVYTGFGTVSGARGAGLWAFYAAALGIAGALVPSRRLAGAQASVLAVVAVGLSGWQVVYLLSLVGLQGWLPGPGLLLVMVGGLLAGRSAVRILSTRP